MIDPHFKVSLRLQEVTRKLHAGNYPSGILGMLWLSPLRLPSLFQCPNPFLFYSELNFQIPHGDLKKITVCMSETPHTFTTCSLPQALSTNGHGSIGVGPKQWMQTKDQQFVFSQPRVHNATCESLSRESSWQNVHRLLDLMKTSSISSLPHGFQGILH